MLHDRNQALICPPCGLNLSFKVFTNVRLRLSIRQVYYIRLILCSKLFHASKVFVEILLDLKMLKGTINSTVNLIFSRHFPIQFI